MRESFMKKGSNSKNTLTCTELFFNVLNCPSIGIVFVAGIQDHSSRFGVHWKRKEEIQILNI